MTNEDKARAIISEDCKKENCLQCGGIYSAEKGGCAEYQKIMQMACWKDEQLESKLIQIIILAQQGYTSGATDEMILKHCKEIIKENHEHNTTKTN